MAAKNVPEWLDLVFLENALKSNEINTNLRIKSMNIARATSDGENYASNMIRVSVEIENEPKKRSYLIKCSHEGNLESYFSVMYSLELEAYRDIIPLMNQYLKESFPGHPQIIPKCFYYKHNEKEMLIMEDLSPDGYKVGDRLTGLNFEQSSIVMKSLGLFHGASAILAERNPEIFQKYSEHLFYSCKKMAEVNSLIMLPLSLEAQFWPECKHLSKKLEKIAYNVYEWGSELNRAKPGEFLVLNHGDVWVNNILLKYLDNQITNVIFVDFQLIYYGSPVLDIYYFFNTSLQDEVRKERLNELLTIYHDSLTDTLKRLNYSKQPPSFEYLQQQMKEKALLGLFNTGINFPIIRSLPEDEFSFDQLINNKDFSFKREKMFSRDSTAKEIRIRLGEFEAQGIFNFD